MITVDAGYFVALLNTDDSHHERAKQFFHTRKEGWMTTWIALTEAMHLLRKRVHLNCAISLLDAVSEGEILIWDVPHQHTTKMKKLMEKYASLPMDLADASMVLLAEHLGHGRILTVDERDFGVYRWKSQKPFVDLMAQSE